MKTTLITTFAIAMMVFAFNTAPAIANEDVNEGFRDIGRLLKCNFEGIDDIECKKRGRLSELDDLDEKDPDQADNERNVADSGDEDSTSAASASEQ